MKPLPWLFAALTFGFALASSTSKADPTVSTATPGVSGASPMTSGASPMTSGASPMTRAAPATPTLFTFESDLRPPYRLRRVRVWVDGALRYDGPGPLGLPLARGDHLISVFADYQMSDPVFSYVRAYRIELRADELVAGRDDGRVVVARAVESGGVTTPIERRAKIVWR
jgi:hypothetical protein